MTVKQELIAYSKACIKNTSECCQKHRWACERFLKDVEREGTDEFPFIFDDEKAERFFRWSKLHKHTKGILANKPIEFTPIQRFIFGNIYGWIHKDTGFRRFRRAYWQVGRKNAKSQSLAIVGDYELMAFGEPSSEVYIGATKTEQAKIIYNEIHSMLKAIPELKGKWKESYSTLQHPKSNSKLKALSKEDGKTGDGLNPSCGLIDEFHAHPTDEILEVINTGMIARTQPLLFIITTAGTNLKGPCYRVEYPLVSKILDPSLDYDVEDYFVMINELDRDSEGNLLDDYNDPKSWIKANPIAATYEVGLKSIESACKLAKESPEKREAFLTKNMNLWLESGILSYMDMAKWRARGVVEEIDIKGLDCYIGIDLSSKIDLTSLTMVVPYNDGYFIMSHSFIPNAQVEAKEKSDHIPYSTWARAGYLTITPGEVIDYRFMTAKMEELANKYGLVIKEICYDPYNATHYAQELEEMGYLCVEVRQGMRTLSEPTKTFRELAYEGKIYHRENPLYDWTMSNAITKIDANENIQLDKEKSHNRIDPIAATMNAMTRALVREGENLNDHILSGEFTL